MKHNVFVNADMDAPEFVDVAGGRVGVFSTRSTDPSHERNEDAAAVLAVDGDRAVLAVADGLGGLRVGDLASSIAIRQLHLAIENGLSDGKNLRGCIIDGFENANRTIVEMGVGAASTLAVAEIDSRVIRSYHAGDSEIMTVGLRGKVKMQTVSHSPVGYAVESGVLDEREAMEHDERHIVSNVVGDSEMRIDVGPPVVMARRDTLLLTTDGLTDNLHAEEIVERIRKGPLETVMHRIASEANERMRRPAGDHPSKPDDLTFLIFRRTK